MKNAWTFVAALAGGIILGGCGTSNDAYEAELRAALAEADINLKDAIVVAASDHQGAASRARLRIDGTATYAVRAFDEQTASDYAIALTGDISSIDDASLGAAPCGELSLEQIVAIAEGAVNGQGVSIEPDDDGGCAYEVQVLTDTELMEVEVSGSGVVLETEVSDEGSGDDDD